MTRVTIDASTAAVLSQLEGEVQLCDAQGRILGWYAPVPPQPTLQELVDSCDISQQELERRLREEKGTGRSWAEIKRELEAT